MEENKELKQWQLRCRFTNQEKEQILAYAERHHLNTSDLTRLAIRNLLEQEEENI